MLPVRSASSIGGNSAAGTSSNDLGPVGCVRPAVRDGVGQAADDRVPGGARVDTWSDELRHVGPGVEQAETVVVRGRAAHPRPGSSERGAPLGAGILDGRERQRRDRWATATSRSHRLHLPRTALRRSLSDGSNRHLRARPARSVSGSCFRSTGQAQRIVRRRRSTTRHRTRRSRSSRPCSGPATRSGSSRRLEKSSPTLRATARRTASARHRTAGPCRDGSGAQRRQARWQLPRRRTQEEVGSSEVASRRQVASAAPAASWRPPGGRHPPHDRAPRPASGRARLGRSGRSRRSQSCHPSLGLDRGGVGLDGRAQRPGRVMQSRAGRAGRDTERFGDLDQLQAHVVMQDEDRALFDRQASERPVERVAIDDGKRCRRVPPARRPAGPARSPPTPG